MARIRSIKPEFWTDSAVVACSPYARLLFVGLWNHADDYGVVKDDPEQLRRQVLPDDEIDGAALVNELIKYRLVVSMVAEDGTPLLVVRSWEKHQKVDKRAPGRYGMPSTFSEMSEDSRQFPPIPSDSPPVPPFPHLGREGKGEEGKGETPPSTDVDVRADPTYRFDDFWDSYPKRRGRRVDKAKAVEAWRRLGYDDKAAAFRGVKHYRADCDRGDTLAKDAFRWLRDRCWEDWQDEAEPSRSLSKQERRLVDLGLVDGFLEACTPNGQPAITTGQVTT